MNGYIFVNCQQCGEDLTQSVLVDTLKSNSDRTFLKIPPHVCKAPAPAPSREAVHSWMEDEVAYCPHCKTRYFQPRYTICQCCDGDHKLVFKGPTQ